MDDCSILPSLLIPALAGIIIVCSCAIIAVAEWQVRMRIRRVHLYEHFKNEFKRVRTELRVKILQVQELVAATEEKEKATNLKRSSNESVTTGKSNSRHRIPTSIHEPLLDSVETPLNRSSNKDKRSKKSVKDQGSKKESEKKELSAKSKSSSKVEKEKKEGTDVTDKKTDKTDKKESKKSQKSKKDVKAEAPAGEEPKEKSFDENYTPF